MSLLDKILGRPLASRNSKQQQLGIITGVPALGLDALSSTAYGPEAGLSVLLFLGLAGLHYFFYLSIAVVITLLVLYFSYRQTIAAYPSGGGAYIVASDNLGQKVGIWAAIALLIDYLLNVAVGISAGIGAVISAFPLLHAHTLLLCLIVLFTLTIINLRGIRESGLFFIFPTLLFVICLSISVVMGLIHTWQTGGHPLPIIAPPPPPTALKTLGIWLLLSAFANGLTAMTGVEAVSNAVPLFRKPSVINAQWTLTIVVTILALMLLALGYLCPVYHLIAMDETQPGYQTLLSQLIAATTGNGIFYYFSIISIFIVLTYSAQTSFVGFPRVCRLLAEDNYLPDFFADRGRRLVYSHGIIILAILSAVLLIIFKGITLSLIPLFAVGAFTAFLLSQLGMVVYWIRNKKSTDYSHIKLFLNALGAVTTAIALAIIIAVKFLEGAWILILLAPLLVILLIQIKQHYIKISREVEKPLQLQVSKCQSPIVIVPIQGWDRVAEKAIRFGLLISDDVVALHVSTEKEDTKLLKQIWSEKVEKPAKSANFAVPELEIIKSPYRRIYQPIVDYVDKIKEKKTNRLIAVVIPELIQAHWYEYLLHNIRAAILRTLLFLDRDQRTVVITTPWYISDATNEKNNH